MAPQERPERREDHAEVRLVRQRAHVADRHRGRTRRERFRRGAEKPFVERVRHDERVASKPPHALRERRRRDDHSVGLTREKRDDPAERVSRVRLPRLLPAEVEQVVVELVDDGDAPPPAPGKDADEPVQLPFVRPERVPFDDEKVAVGNRVRRSVRQLDPLREGWMGEGAQEADVRAAIGNLRAIEPVEDVDPTLRQTGPRGCPRPRGRACGGRRRRSPARQGAGEVPRPSRAVRGMRCIPPGTTCRRRAR